MNSLIYQVNRVLKAAAITFIFGVSCLSADHDRQNNSLVPIGRLVLNPEFCDGNVAFGILGEAGKDNARGNATVGFVLAPNHSVKVGGEYLTQKLKYGFLDGHTKKWVHQWAVGGKYLARFDGCFITGVTGGGYYASAESKKLSSHDLSSTQLLSRRIAGADAAGGEAGVLLDPWYGATLTLLADYDHVRFKRRYETNHNFNGFGWSAALSQNFYSDFDLSLKAEMRKPFNNYTARLIYTGYNTFGPYTFGLFGGYTHGKSRLPNVTVAGIEFGLNFGGFSSGARYGDSQGECGIVCSNQPCRSGLANWVLEPAVYMPMVLAVRDQKIVTTCAAPQAVGVIPGILSPPDDPFFNASAYFTGDNLAWSIVSDDPSQVAAQIDSTGFVFVSYAGGFGAANVTVTATNACGSAQSTFPVLFETN